jgi:serine protease inhibitor
MRMKYVRHITNKPRTAPLRPIPMNRDLLRRRGARRAAGLAGIAALAVAGCGSAAPPSPRPPAAVIARGVALREPLVNPRPYGAADTAFGLDLLGAWCRAEPQANLVLSPSSLASGLGMAYLGARGGTAAAIAAVLHLPADGQTLEAGLQARSAALRALDGPGVTVDASDQVWTDPTLTTLPSYLNAVATAYDAGVAHAPLLTDPSRAIAEIDQAIAAATRGQIPQLLAPGSLDDIGWVLTDALYLHAAWATPFPASQTSPGSFTTASGRQATAQFMDGGPYQTVSADGWTAVWLPYRGGKLAMVALLPPAGAAACAMPAATALGTLTGALAAGSAGDVAREVYLPRADLSSDVSMKSLLAGLGMGVAFTSSADFTGLSPQACCIGLVQQADTLRVGEQGTTASAATAVGVMPGAAMMGPSPVNFDRPYLMLVTDAATGEPLFLARVANPAAR